MEREPGAIIRDRYVLTAPFGDADAAIGWRAVDMVLRRRVIVVFDTAERGAANPPDEPVAPEHTDQDDQDEADDTGPSAGEAGESTDEAADTPEDEETAAEAGDAAPGPIPLHAAVPDELPVGEILDGGHWAGGYYRVFRAADDDDADIDPATTEPEDQTRVVPLAPPDALFGAIDGADVTRPMGLPAGEVLGFEMPVDPTTELPDPDVLLAGAAETFAPMDELEPATGDLDAIEEPADAEAAEPAAQAPRRRRRAQAFLLPVAAATAVPIPVTAVVMLLIVGLSGFLLLRPSRSGSTPIDSPPAVADAAPAPTTTTTMVPETTTTETTLPETTTTLPPTTWRRPTTVTEPPETTPPSTSPPETEPPTTVQTSRPRPTISLPTTRTTAPTTTATTTDRLRPFGLT